MSEKINIGPKIVLEGEKEYRQSISDVNRSMKVLQSELKAVSAEFDGNANSLEALQAKNNVYKKQQEEQAKKLELLRGALENVSKKYGENSSQAQDWQAKLNNAYAELQKINKSLDQNEKHMKEAEQSTDKTSKSIDEYGKEVKKAKDETISFGDILKANLASEAIISGVKTLVNGMKSVVTETEEFRRDFSKLEANSKNAGAAIGDVSKELKYLDAITKETDSNIEALSNLLQAGFTGDNLSDIVSSLAGAVIKFPDTLKIEGLSDSLQETMATGKGIGQFGEMLERLGYNLDDFNDRFSKTTTEAEKQQFILNTLASSGLSKVNEEYAKNNKEMIEYSNAQYKLREIMSEIAEKVTPLLTQSMGVLADNIGDIAEDIMPLFLNGFEWMVKNSDKIEAGLKGIGAALITKKAADGVVFVAQAYKTLTTATQAATTAQVAFNTATKASVVGAVATAVVGLGVALWSYADKTNKAAEETSRLRTETDKLLESSRQLNKDISESNNLRDKNTQEIEAEMGAAKALADSLYDLSEKENKNNEDKNKMIVLVQELNNLIPELNLSIDEQTGFLSMQGDELERLIEKQMEYNRLQAVQEDLVRIAKEQYEAEKNLVALEAEKSQLKKDMQEQEKYLEEGRYAYEKNMRSAVKNATKDWNDARLRLIEVDEEIIKTNASLNTLAADYKYASDYIGENGLLNTDELSDIDQFAKKYSRFLEDIKKEELGTLEDRQEKIVDIYDETSKQLEKTLRAEERTFNKSQETRLKKVKESQTEELETLKDAHKAKLKLIEDEYLENLKIADEEKYNALKAVQDQIDAIDNQQEAEDRARKLREETEKKQELNLRIESAKTLEERLEAQKALKDYEEELARERLKNERSLQKEVLNKQKENIEETYKTKVENLQEERKTAEKKREEEYELEKKALEKSHELVIEAIRDTQELEKESFRERQDEYREFLKEQKDLAIANSKEIYEKDLAQYKLSQALKYEKVVNNEQSIKNEIQKYAYQNMQPGMARDKILYSTDLKEMLQYYNPVVPKQTTVASGPTIEYYKIEDAMTNALKKMNLTVQIDGKALGKVIDNRINHNLR